MPHHLRELKHERSKSEQPLRVTMPIRALVIDEKIKHYQNIAAEIIDRLTADRIEKLIADLKAQKLALHPSENNK
jgi:hypothetical protein